MLYNEHALGFCFRILCVRLHKFKDIEACNEENVKVVRTMINASRFPFVKIVMYLSAVNIMENVQN